MKSTFNLSLQKISRIAILSALCVALRYAFSSLPNIQPITAIFLITAIVYGLSDSILIMSLTMLVSSFLLMFGPWVIWQIFSFTVILVIWKYLLYPLTKFLKFAKINEIVWQSLFAGLLGIVYGLVIDSCYAFLMACRGGLMLWRAQALT